MKNTKNHRLSESDKSILSHSILLVVVLGALFFLWNTKFIYPLKILTVFFHESSHAIMTVVTGGEVVELEVNQFQGGHVISRGGNRFLTLSAGYLGSLLWGALIYLIAAKTRKDKQAMSLLGSIMIVIALLIIRNTFGFLFTVGTGLVLIVLGIRAPEKINDVILRVIGLSSMVYVPLDIFSDTISRSHLMSDARMLAREFGGFTMMWGGVWIALSLVIFWFTIKWSVSSSSGRRAE